MKKQVYVSFNEGRARYQYVRHLLKTIDCEQGLAGEGDFLCGLYGRMFDSDDPQLELLLCTLRAEGIKWSERIEHIYSDAELRSFPLLVLGVNRKEIDPYGPSHGTTYDLSNACPQCGSGAVQTSPFYAPAKSFPKSGMICYASTEVFAAEALADGLRRAETTGLELRQVQSSRDNVPLPWWQMIPRSTMPKMSGNTKGITRSEKPPPCPVCQRDGHYHTVKEPMEIIYNSTDVLLDSLPDVVQTWECFGVSGIDRENFRRSRFAAPAILVKPRVFDIFRKLKGKHAHFAPVRIV